MCKQVHTDPWSSDGSSGRDRLAIQRSALSVGPYELQGVLACGAHMTAVYVGQLCDICELLRTVESGHPKSQDK